MSEIPSNKNIDIEAVKREILSEAKLFTQQYVSDVLDPFLEDEDDEAGDDGDSPPDPGPDPNPPKDYPLSLKFKNSNGRYVSPINPETGQLRTFGVVSSPDGQGNISVTVMSKIDGDLEERPSYYRISYQLVD